jgi:hypothetical protein
MLTVSWRCPACQNAIRHSDVETTPRPGMTYRCPICRLELVVDSGRGVMMLAPLPGDEVDDSHDRKKPTMETARAEPLDRQRTRQPS